MSAEHPDPKREAFIQAEVDRAVAKWKGVAPPHMLAKMRTLAERYLRENPVASRVVDTLSQRPAVPDASTERNSDAGTDSDDGSGRGT